MLVKTLNCTGHNNRKYSQSNFICFLSKSKRYSLRNEQKCWKTPHLDRLTKRRKKFLDQSECTPKVKGVYSALKSSLLPSFEKIGLEVFFVILFTNQQTDVAENINSLVEVIINSFSSHLQIHLADLEDLSKQMLLLSLVKCNLMNTNRKWQPCSQLCELYLCTAILWAKR